MRLLLPHVWPKDSPALQVLVLLCVGLLLAERLVNVLVPVYSKNIGKYIKQTQIADNFVSYLCNCSMQFIDTPVEGSIPKYFKRATLPNFGSASNIHEININLFEIHMSRLNSSQAQRKRFHGVGSSQVPAPFDC